MDTLLHPLNEEKSEVSVKRKSFLMGAFFLFMIAGGILAGLFAARFTMKDGKKNVFLEKNNVVTKAGIKDKAVFKDKATGILKKGGIDGEGSFHLERPGGESQNVYLTSSTVDLTQFVGKKVEVWGKTYKAKKAGWLMDVGYIEVK